MEPSNRQPPAPEPHSLSTPQTSALLRLPPELRNAIYAELVDQSQVLWVGADYNASVEHSRPATPPAITQVCRMTRAETLPMYYGNNIFCVSLICKKDRDRANRWAATVENASVLNIKHLRFHGQSDSGPSEYRTTWIEIERPADGVVHVTDSANDSDGHGRFRGQRVQSAHALSLSAYIHNNCRGRKSLSSTNTLKAMIRSFANFCYLPSEGNCIANITALLGRTGDQRRAPS